MQVTIKNLKLNTKTTPQSFLTHRTICSIHNQNGNSLSTSKFKGTQILTLLGQDGEYEGYDPQPEKLWFLNKFSLSLPKKWIEIMDTDARMLKAFNIALIFCMIFKLFLREH